LRAIDQHKWGHYFLNDYQVLTGDMLEVIWPSGIKGIVSAEVYPDQLQHKDTLRLRVETLGDEVLSSEAVVSVEKDLAEWVYIMARRLPPPEQKLA
jgi:hypothetical protein